MLFVSDFEMHEEPDAVTLTIKAREAARATVEALFRGVPASGGADRREPATIALGCRWAARLVYPVDLPRQGDPWHQARPR